MYIQKMLTLRRTFNAAIEVENRVYRVGAKSTF